MMKKFLFGILLTVLAGGTLRAQGPHEIHISVSGPAGGYQYSDAYGSLYDWGTDLYSMYEEGVRVDAGPVFSVGYTYALRSWLRPGVEASWGLIWADKAHPRAFGNGEVDLLSQRYFTIMPLVHLVALDKPHFKIYGKIATGGQLSVGDFAGTKICSAWQFVPLGIQWGGEKVFGLFEMGYGNVYLARLGMGIRW